MGSKQSIPGATEWVFFQITFFGTKKHQKNWTVSLLINSPIIYMPLSIVLIIFSDIRTIKIQNLRKPYSKLVE